MHCKVFSHSMKRGPGSARWMDAKRPRVMLCGQWSSIATLLHARNCSADSANCVAWLAWVLCVLNVSFENRLFKHAPEDLSFQIGTFYHSHNNHNFSNAFPLHHSNFPCWFFSHVHVWHTWCFFCPNKASNKETFHTMPALTEVASVFEAVESENKNALHAMPTLIQMCWIFHRICKVRWQWATNCVVSLSVATKAFFTLVMCHKSIALVQQNTCTKQSFWGQGRKVSWSWCPCESQFLLLSFHFYWIFLCRASMSVWIIQTVGLQCDLHVHAHETIAMKNGLQTIWQPWINPQVSVIPELANNWHTFVCFLVIAAAILEWRSLCASELHKSESIVGIKASTNHSLNHFVDVHSAFLKKRKLILLGKYFWLFKCKRRKFCCWFSQLSCRHDWINELKLLTGEEQKQSDGLCERSALRHFWDHSFPFHLCGCFWFSSQHQNWIIKECVHGEMLTRTRMKVKTETIQIRWKWKAWLWVCLCQKITCRWWQMKNNGKMFHSTFTLLFSELWHLICSLLHVIFSTSKMLCHF